MKLVYSFEEPMPDVPKTRTWPIWVALGACNAAMWSLLPFFPGWNLLAMVPYFGFLTFWVLRVWHLHKKFDRELDAWSERRHAWYDRPIKQREKAVWS